MQEKYSKRGRNKQIILTLSKEQLTGLVKNYKTLSEILLAIGVTVHSRWIKLLRKRLDELDIFYFFRRHFISLNGQKMRKCSHCQQIKSEKDFYKEKRGLRINLTCRCKNCLNNMRKATYKKNLNRELEYGKAKRIEYLRQWNMILIDRYGNEPICAICSKKLKYFSEDIGTSVCFDHRSYDGSILRPPRHWLQSHPCNEQNIKTFESHNFGILCRMCNAFLGKENRRQKLFNLNRYLEIENICKS